MSNGQRNHISFANLLVFLQSVSHDVAETLVAGSHDPVRSLGLADDYKALMLLQGSVRFVQSSDFNFGRDSDAPVQLFLPELVLPSVLRSRSGGKCLRFIHIPKTGGTSVELTGHKSSFELDWGHFDQALTCNDPFPCHFGDNWALSARHGRDDTHTCCKLEGGQCDIWHVPPRRDLKLAQTLLSDDCDTFCVVRDPVDRMVSQFLHRGGQCNITAFQQFVLEETAAPEHKRYRQDCHFVPQVEYVFSENHEVQYCRHILHTDHLEAEFNALMTSFDIPLSLIEENKRAHTCKLQVPKRLRDRITDAYKEDCKEAAALNFTSC